MVRYRLEFPSSRWRPMSHTHSPTTGDKSESCCDFQREAVGAQLLITKAGLGPRYMGFSQDVFVWGSLQLGLLRFWVYFGDPHLGKLPYTAHSTGMAGGSQSEAYRV